MMYHTHEIINCSFAWTHKKEMKSRRKQADHDEYLEEGNPKSWFINSMQQKNGIPGVIVGAFQQKAI
jgi:hypothetical protein